MKASATIEIAKPIQDTWNFVSDLANMGTWVTGVSDVRLESDRPVIAGTKFSSKYTYGKKTHEITYEVTEIAAPYRMSMKSTSGPFPFEGWIELQEIDAHTKLINTIDAGSDSVATTIIFAVFGPLLRIMMRKQLGKELQALKKTLET